MTGLTAIQHADREAYPSPMQILRTERPACICMHTVRPGRAACIPSRTPTCLHARWPNDAPAFRSVPNGGDSPPWAAISWSLRCLTGGSLRRWLFGIIIGLGASRLRVPPGAGSVLSHFFGPFSVTCPFLPLSQF